MYSLLIVPYLVALVSATNEYSCVENSSNPDTHCVHNLVLDSSQSLPSAPALFLNNCTVDHLPPDALGNGTEQLWILDGSAPKVHLSPSLKSFTSLRAGTQEVIIDPEDNYRLEVFDLEGGARKLSANVARLRALQVLDLCNNVYEEFSLDVLNGLNQLRKINLGWNRLKTVQVKNVNLPSLRELFLQGNLLTSLDFTGLTAPNLQRLYVSSNQLTFIDGLPSEVPKFPNLVRMDLYGNNWFCDWLALLNSSFKDKSVETLNYLPKKVCNEAGTVAASELQCQERVR